jgi:putative PIN family toxin of toxin-antitoxin system
VTVVLDTNVWVSALHFKALAGTPAHVLTRAVFEDTLAICPEIEAEIVRVLTQRFGRDRSQVASLLNRSLSGAIWVEIAGSVRACRDPQDDMVLECAHRAGADLIVTGDKDLLVLGSFESIRIVTPAEYLAMPR